jgi:circadian clock protein KaiC
MAQNPKHFRSYTNLMPTKQMIEKLETHIPGFDVVTEGGLPKGRTTLVSGTAGSGKTVLAAQFLAKGITEADEAGVFVTFEESPHDIRRNILSLGWNVLDWEADGKWLFVDASPQLGEEIIIAGHYDLGGLLARIENAVKRSGAKRLVMDSLGAIFSRFEDVSVVRNELFRIASAIKTMGVTAIMTAERRQEYGDISRFGVEEFVADNVIILRNVLEDEKRRRTLEILKYRGTSHHKGEYPFHHPAQPGHCCHPAGRAGVEATLLRRARHLRQQRAGRHVRRRILPRFDYPGFRRNRHGQNPDYHRVCGRRG